MVSFYLWGGNWSGLNRDPTYPLLLEGFGGKLARFGAGMGFKCVSWPWLTQPTLLFFNLCNIL